MSSTPTPLLRLEIQTAGENDDTWGDKANTVFTLLENAIAKRQSIALSNTDHTLTTTNYADDEARSLCLALTGILSANVNVIVPALSKMYLIDNGTSGAYAVTVKTPSGSGVACAQGSITMVYCNGTNVVSIAIASVDNSSNLGGVAASSYARKDAQQGFSAGQGINFKSLAYASSITPNAAESNYFATTLSGNATLENPANPADGQTIEIWVRQDGAGSRTLTYGSKFRWPNDATPTLTTMGNRLDIIVATYYQSLDRWLASMIQNYNP